MQISGGLVKTSYLERFLQLLQILRAYHSCTYSIACQINFIIENLNTQTDAESFLKLWPRDLSFNNLSGPIPKILAEDYR